MSGFSSTRYADERGFTLLEVILLVAVLGFIAAMTLPFLGKLNDVERARLTREKMELIHRALLGSPDRYDEEGRRIISGYVGDFGNWPELWEEKPAYRETASGTEVFDPTDPSNLNVFFYRPSGRFTNQGWQWSFPNRRLTDDTLHNQDHIGGLATENEGQPRGLWTDDPAGDGSSLLSNRWRGPYLARPYDQKPQDSDHWATSDTEYAALAPARLSGVGEDWEEGDYTPADGDPGEHFDDKEAFRLLQTDGRLSDGWERSLRFFISKDPDHPGETIFWIISEGPDYQGTYPTKGSFDGSSWTVNPDDTMDRLYDPATPELGGYDENAPYNLDNIVTRISSIQWRPLLAEREAARRAATVETMTRLRRALVGSTTPAEGGPADGFTNTLCRLPHLFRWEGTHWDERDATDTSYSKGSPRGLWTDKPNSSDSGDDLAAPGTAERGMGWRGPYLTGPAGVGQDEVLLDGWGRELLFFRDMATDKLLMLSRGSDGRFDFYNTDTLPEGTPDGVNDYYEPADFTEVVDVSTYDPADAGGYNADNVTQVVDGHLWRGALMSLHLRIFNATAGSTGTKAVFYRGWDFGGGMPLANTPIFPEVAELTDEDGDGNVDDWYRPAAFVYDETTPDPAIAGSRQLLIWNDADGDDTPDGGENGIILVVDLRVQHGLGNEHRTVTIDTATHFSMLP